MGKGIESVDIDESDLLLVAAELGGDVADAIASGNLYAIEQAAASLGAESQVITVGLDVNFGDGKTVHYDRVPLSIAGQMTADPSRYNELLRGQYS